MKMRKLHISLIGFFSILGFIVLFILMAPVQIGGKIGYVIVSGESMEPVYSRGDLVITRQSDSYQIGDIAAYDNLLLGGIVIHRITDEYNGHFTFKGDNNNFYDRYQPNEDEIVGKEWLHLPKLGSYIMTLREPSNFTIVITILFAFVLFPSPKDQKYGEKDPANKEIYRGGFMSNKDQTQDIIASVVVVGMIALVVLVISFSNPVTELVNESSSFQHQGSFNYKSDSVEGVYDGITAETGDPMFFQTSEKVQIDFDYNFLGFQFKDIQGTYSLNARILGANGWTRTLEIIPSTEFDSLPISFSGELCFSEIIERIETYESLTDTISAPYYLYFVPKIELETEYRNKPVSFVFAPDLRFEIRNNSLELVFDEEEKINPQEVAITTVEVERSGTLSFFALEVPVYAIRWFSGLVFVLSGIAVYWMYLEQKKILDANGSAAIIYQYGNLIASVSKKPRVPDMIIVDDLEDVISIAKQTGGMVFCNRRGKFVYYFVKANDEYYYYRLEEEISNDETESASDEDGE